MQYSQFATSTLFEHIVPKKQLQRGWKQRDRYRLLRDVYIFYHFFETWNFKSWTRPRNFGILRFECYTSRINSALICDQIRRKLSSNLSWCIILVLLIGKSSDARNVQIIQNLVFNFASNSQMRAQIFEIHEFAWPGYQFISKWSFLFLSLRQNPFKSYLERWIQQRNV